VSVFLIFQNSSLLLKFAEDVKLTKDKFLYSGKPVGCSEFAMKGAAQELIAADRLFEYFRQHKHKILIPMQTIVDYLGCRVVVMPLLPVGEDTLVQGSADAGKTLVTKPEVEHLLHQAGQEFFLAVHRVLGHEISIAGDVEVHQFKYEVDQYFLIDLARVYPPQCPTTMSTLRGRLNPGSQVFFRLFRPEYLINLKGRKSETGLTNGISSDVFSRWGSEDSGTHNLAGTKATEYFCRCYIKEVAESLNITQLRNIGLPSNSTRIASLLHYYGVNMRFLGALAYYCVKDKESKICLCDNIFVRTSKNVMRQLMRSQSSYSSAIELVCEYVNFCLHNFRNQGFEEFLKITGLSFEMESRFGSTAVGLVKSFGINLVPCFVEAFNECGLTFSHRMMNFLAKKANIADVVFSPKDILCSVTIISKMACFERQVLEEMDQKAGKMMREGMFQSSFALRQECLERLQVLELKKLSGLESLMVKQKLILSVLQGGKTYDNKFPDQWNEEDHLAIVDALFKAQSLHKSFSGLVSSIFEHSESLGLKVALMILARCFRLNVSFQFSQEVDFSIFSDEERRVISFLFAVLGVNRLEMVKFSEEQKDDFLPLHLLLRMVEQLESEKKTVSDILPLLLPPAIWLVVFDSCTFPIFKSLLPEFVNMSKLSFYLVFQIYSGIPAKMNLQVEAEDFNVFKALSELYKRFEENSSYGGEVATDQLAGDWFQNFCGDKIDIKESYLHTRHFDVFLQFLNWIRKPITLQFIETFGFEVNPPAITSISFVKQHLQVIHVQALLNADFDTLQSLNVSRNELGIEGASHMAQASWPELKHLDISENEITAGGLAAISRATWKKLQSLNIYNNSIKEAGVLHLLEARWTMLQTLDISMNGIGPAGATQLAQVDWPYLQHLNISYNDIGDEGSARIFEGQWPLLHTLDIDNNKITEDGAKWIVRASWPQLQFLDISFNRIGDIGASSIAQCTWNQLRRLNLGGNSIGDAGISSIAQANWPELEDLIVYSNSFDASKLRDLMDHFKLSQEDDYRYQGHLEKAEKIRSRRYR
jgi:Leucine-rich repeat (LRR) protein